MDTCVELVRGTVPADALAALSASDNTTALRQFLHQLEDQGIATGGMNISLVAAAVTLGCTGKQHHLELTHRALSANPFDLTRTEYGVRFTFTVTTTALNAMKVRNTFCLQLPPQQHRHPL